jgi:hypothetical protein
MLGWLAETCQCVSLSFLSLSPRAGLAPVAVDVAAWLPSAREWPVLGSLALSLARLPFFALRSNFRSLIFRIENRSNCETVVT